MERLFVLPALHYCQLIAPVSLPQSPLGSVSACGKNAARSLGSPLPTSPVSLGRRRGPIFTCTSGSPSPPAHHSGYCTRFPRGFPIRQAGWEPCFILSAAGGMNPPGGRVRFRRTPGRRTAPTPFRGGQGPRREDHLYFRLSITASSSQRLLYSFSAWPLTQW